MATSAVQPLSSSQHGGDAFNLSDFVKAQPTPLVCIQFGAQWCGPCKQVAPLYEKLAQSVSGRIGCFKVDVEESENIAVAADISNLPTFKFYTTKLAPNNELQQVEEVVGVDENALKINFSKGGQIAAAFLQQQQSAAQKPAQHQAQPASSPAQNPAHQAVQPASSPAQNPAQPASSHQPTQGGATGANQVVKQELLEIRAALLAALQRTERLYSALQ